MMSIGVSRLESFAQGLAVQFVCGEQEGGSVGRGDPQEGLIVR